MVAALVAVAVAAAANAANFNLLVIWKEVKNYVIS